MGYFIIYVIRGQIFLFPQISRIARIVFFFFRVISLIRGLFYYLCNSWTYFSFSHKFHEFHELVFFFFRVISVIRGLFFIFPQISRIARIVFFFFRVISVIRGLFFIFPQISRIARIVFFFFRVISVIRGLFYYLCNSWTDFSFPTNFTNRTNCFFSFFV